MGPTDEDWQYSGWNIDDVQLTASETSVLIGDIVGDCQVDLDDLAFMAERWLDLCDDCESADLYIDGKITLQDFNLLTQHWLEGVSP